MRTKELIAQFIGNVASGKQASSLDLRDTVCFRRRTRSQPFDFSDFLDALRQSTTLRSILCHTEFTWSLTDIEWVKLVKVFGEVKGLQEIRFVAPLDCMSMRSTPFDALAQCLRNGRGIRSLIFDRKTVFEGDNASYLSFADALRHHPNLTRFWWKCDVFRPSGPVDGCFDPVALALSTCRQLEDAYLLFTTAAGVESFLSAKAVQALAAASPNLRNLSLTTKQWQAVAQGLEDKNCSLQRCSIGKSTATLADIQTLSKALQVQKSSLRHLQLVSGTGFDDNMGILMAEALKKNTSLELIEFHDSWWSGGGAFVQNFFREPTYSAFTDCLNLNFSVRVILKVGIAIDDSLGVAPGFLNFKISSILNRLGRGKLLLEASDPTSSLCHWLLALTKLSDAGTYETPDEQELLATSCIFSLLRLSPNVICTDLRHCAVTHQL